MQIAGNIIGEYINRARRTGGAFLLGVLCMIACPVRGQSVEAASVRLETSAEAICISNPFLSFIPRYTDDGTYGNSRRFLYEYSSDGTTWRTFATSGIHYTQRPTNLWEGWYRVSMTRVENIGNPTLYVTSEPVYLSRVDGGCTPFAHPWPDEVSDEVCPRGTLLFREDFGGNSPSDPLTRSTRLTTMSSRYYQHNDVLRTGPSSGRFIVAKQGWQNGLNTSTTDNMFSQWFIQDDHTYPNDYTRGYLLEVDGIGGNDAFYTTTFPVCHELDLSFSAYVANVLEPGHAFAKPKVRFLIQNEATGDTILEQSSGEIAPAPEDYLTNGYPTVQSAPWHLVGASFHVPPGVSMIRLSIFNDVNTGMGNDFAMDDIEIRLCQPVVTVEGEHEICMDSAYTFTGEVTTDGSFQQPYNYLWQYAQDSLPFNSDDWTDVAEERILSYDSIPLAAEGWYRLCVTSNGVDVRTERYCRAMSEPFHLVVRDCTPCPDVQVLTIDTVVCDTLMPVTWCDTLFTEPGSFSRLYYDRRGCDSLLTVYTLRTELCCPEARVLTIDTVVCDTLMPFTWRDTLFTEPGSFTHTLHDRRGCDSLLTTYTLRTELCCPDLRYAAVDTVVCDTLMPFTWRGMLFTEPGEQLTTDRDSRGCDILQTRWTLATELCCPDLRYATHDTVVCDTLMPFLWHGLLFSDPAEQQAVELSPRGCDSILHIYTLDTVHCERLWPIIVNKYNWQLLCDNVALRRYFPDHTPTAFLWYKNEQPVPGATWDDYAEQNELHGRFQLRVTLDGNLPIWSNIIVLEDAEAEEEPQPLLLQVYNSRGERVPEDRITHGIYLFRYEQGAHVRTEKRMVP